MVYSHLNSHLSLPNVFYHHNLKRYLYKCTKRYIWPLCRLLRTPKTEKCLPSWQHLVKMLIPMTEKATSRSTQEACLQWKASSCWIGWDRQVHYNYWIMELILLLFKPKKYTPVPLIVYLLSILSVIIILSLIIFLILLK